MTKLINTLKAIHLTLETLGAIAGKSMRQQTFILQTKNEYIWIIYI